MCNVYLFVNLQFHNITNPGPLDPKSDSLSNHYSNEKFTVKQFCLGSQWLRFKHFPNEYAASLT